MNDNRNDNRSGSTGKSAMRRKGRGVAVYAALALSALLLSADDTVTVFVNKTPWTVHVVAGSGRADVCDIAPWGQAEVKNLAFRDETYYPLFDVPLTESFSLKNLRPADRDFYVRLDTGAQTGGQRRSDRVEITAPEGFNDTGAYLVLTNASRSGGVSLSRNDSLYRMIPLSAANNADVVNAGESAVYAVNPAEFASFTVRPGNLSSGPLAFRRGMVYRFLFDGASVVMTDRRPLVRAGEKGWVKAISETDTALQLARNTNASDTITVFSSGKSGIERRLFLSDGNSGGNGSGNGDSQAVMRQRAAGVTITGAFRTSGGDVMVTGYRENGYAGFLPVLQKQREDGGLAAELESPRNPKEDRRAAYFLAAAEGANGELAVTGGADSGINDASVYKAYIRAVRETQGGFAPLWELGPAEFDAAAKDGIRYGEINTVVFDRNRDQWIAAGKIIAYDALKNPEDGSFIVSIDRAGTIRRIDTYRNMLFNRIALDEAGNQYLAGEEKRAGGSYAVVVKRAPAGNGDEDAELWRGRNRPEADSFYQDMVVDIIDNGDKGDGNDKQIVLAGTVRAADSDGRAGTPFIEGINAETGDLLWRQLLTDGAFRGTAIVTGIERAPFYGFVLALSGIEDGYFAPPFLIARVNDRGKL
jgi:hypothetical protein